MILLALHWTDPPLRVIFSYIEQFFFLKNIWMLATCNAFDQRHCGSRQEGPQAARPGLLTTAPTATRPASSPTGHGPRPPTHVRARACVQQDPSGPAPSIFCLATKIHSSALYKLGYRLLCLCFSIHQSQRVLKITVLVQVLFQK
jgi:hypothetical protein